MTRLDTKKAATYIPCAKSTLDKLRVTGGGPRFIKLGKRVLYDTLDLDRWLEAQKRASTVDTGAPSPGRRRR
ncbi:helix-turn-helix domain-containing protein [Bradyrhizobium sp. Ash2021]|uniref:helix-turn-helix transcriptional regulator n=1 Tax=Bradyrhizobium sp. Ash2021 TaxID=2954771 RepID=UPI0028152CF5|nr:helix-turn-helix domain-containing protein [Bradyrhizobium sp. Ash2021]WMT70929.1 helix-turn-helix domain-containing protein [Bradyrhizobium sp. Ash2021]